MAQHDSLPRHTPTASPPVDLKMNLKIDLEQAKINEHGQDLAAQIGPPGAASTDPFALAAAWLEEAKKSEINDPNAMALATVDPDGMPNVRMVLLKEIAPANSQDDGRGAFVFYTNYESVKGREIEYAGKAALGFHWKSLRRQIRIRGHVLRVAADQADAYYASRPYVSRLGAWASKQSQPLESRAALAAAVMHAAVRHPISPPRPPHWGGYRVIPDEIEFWANGSFRLHDRWHRIWNGKNWDVSRLNP